MFITFIILYICIKQKQIIMKTIKNYTETKFRIGWGIITNEGIIIAKFSKKEAAEDFKANAYFGYYNDCEIKFIKK